MIDKDFLFEQQLKYFGDWVDQLNKERLREIQDRLDESFGKEYFRDQLKPYGIKF